MRKLDDIIPPSRRPIQDMAPAPSITKSPSAPLRLSRKQAKFPLFTIVTVVVILAVGITGLFYFSGAKVEIVPQSKSAVAQGTFSATQGSGDLPFLIITATKVATQSVTGSGTKTVQTNASGAVTIYNTQAKPQKLIANTRFATSAGLIFRIHSAVTVPAGTASSPGSVQATLYADQAGASYNVDATSFTLPGLAGTAQSAQVYAKSTGSMTGGASGQIPVVDTSTESAARSALTTALAPDLATAISAQIPQGYVLLTGSATTTYKELTPAPSATTGKVDVREQGTITAVVFPNSALAKAIASSVSALDYHGEPLTLTSTNGLVVSALTPSANSQTMSFTLSGTANLLYTVDSTRIASAIAGKSRSAAEVALSSYPEVKRAILTLRPFWKSSFPEDPASITVIVDTP